MRYYILPILIMFTLIGCGGGGGSTDTSETGNQPAEPNSGGDIDGVDPSSTSVPIIATITASESDGVIWKLAINNSNTEIAVLYANAFTGTRSLRIHSASTGLELREIEDGFLKDESSLGPLYWAENDILTMVYSEFTIVDSDLVPVTRWKSWNGTTAQALNSVDVLNDFGEMPCGVLGDSRDTSFDPITNRLFYDNNSRRPDGSDRILGGVCRADLNTFTIDFFEIAEYPFQRPSAMDITPRGDTAILTYQELTDDLTEFADPIEFTTMYFDTETFFGLISANQHTGAVLADAKRWPEIKFAGDNFTVMRDSWEGETWLLPDKVKLQLPLLEFVAASSANVIAGKFPDGSVNPDQVVSLPDATLIGTLEKRTYDYFDSQISADGTIGGFVKNGSQSLDVLDFTARTSISVTTE